MASPSASRAVPDAIVVGGGVIGLAIAEELARRGGRVQVFDKRRPGGEASWAAGGMLAADYECDARATPLQDLAFRSRALWPEYAARLHTDYSTDVRLRTEGTLAPAFDAPSLERLHTRLDGRSFGGRVEWLDAGAVRDREPALATTVRGAAWLRDDLVCENRALLFALLRATRKLGVAVHADSPASLRVEGGRVRGIVTGSRRVDAELTINASGAWIGAAAGIPGHPTLHPVRGQMLGFHAEREDALRHVVRWEGGYAIPRSAGRIVVGSTTEPDAGFTKGVTREAVERLTGELRAALPGLVVERRHAWSGLRPASEDGLPVLGGLPDVGGYLLAGGHYRNGILLTPITASLIADLAEGKQPAMALDAFAASRATLASSSIVVNGASRALKPGTTVKGLLSELLLERPGVAVAVNEEVVRRGDWDRTVLTRNDRVEIIHAVGGG